MPNEPELLINWEISQEDFDLLIKVCERAERELNGCPERRTLVMDLNAAHSNGCPLDFKGLLEASTFDLSHDIGGIREHINPRTGQVLGFFTPRYALANRVPEETCECCHKPLSECRQEQADIWDHNQTDPQSNGGKP